MPTKMSNDLRGVIYLDGPNASGKSTLAQELQRRFPNSISLHCKYRFKTAMWQYHLAALRRALRFADTGLAIIDRNWLSEEVYAHVYRNGTKWPHQGRILQKLLLKHGVVTVMCIMPEDRVAAQVAAHRQKGYHSPQFVSEPGAIAHRYWHAYYGNQVEKRNTYVDDLMDQGGMQIRKDALCYQLDKDGTDMASAIEHITNKLFFTRQTQYAPALEFNQRNVAGHLYLAKWLIVGDTVNHLDYKKCWPFMAYKNSSLFIAEAMHQLNCREEEFMWTNAECPEEHLVALADHGLKVITLGSKATSAVKKHGIPHTSIHHPSYGRRFMSLQDWTAEFNGVITI